MFKDAHDLQLTTSLPASFVICTRDRPRLLKRCLQTVTQQVAQNQEIIVIDNSSTGSGRVVTQQFGAKWIQEFRPGSAWARNRGYLEAKYEIVAYIDDDCEADVVWAQELLAPFVDPTVSVVTGSVLASRPDLAVPHLIDGEYPFHRGWSAMRYNGSTGTKWSPFDIWRVGTGANMAWRKSLLATLGGFDPALGAGTPAGSCEDIDALRRAISAGAVICYEPTALVWHTHPETMQDLQEMLIRYAVTLGAHAAKIAFEEGQWKGLLFLICDWRWQISWSLRLVFSASSEANVHMPALSILMQPPASIIGMYRFIKHRRGLRNGEAMPPRSLKRRCPAVASLESGVVGVQVELGDVVADEKHSSKIRLLVRCDKRPIFATDITPGQSLIKAIQDELPTSIRRNLVLRMKMTDTTIR